MFVRVSFEVSIRGSDFLHFSVDFVEHNSDECDGILMTLQLNSKFSEKTLSVLQLHLFYFIEILQKFQLSFVDMKYICHNSIRKSVQHKSRRKHII